MGRWRGWGLGPCPGWLERKYKDECSLRNASLYVVTWSQAAFSPGNMFVAISSDSTTLRRELLNGPHEGDGELKVHCIAAYSAESRV